MIIMMAVASFLTIFSLVLAKAYIAQGRYQLRVINEREKAAKQLKENVQSAGELHQKYKDFDSALENIIGGSSAANAKGERDGPNSRLVLDALPSKYDFPALATSLEKILVDGGYRIESIVGVDDEIVQSKQASATTPEPLEMPFVISAAASYASVQKLVGDFERSIRPFQLTSLELNGNDANMEISVEAKTYYQPEKNLDIKKKVVK